MAQVFWKTQSPVTEPGRAAEAIDELNSDLEALRDRCSQLIYHYRAGNFAKDGVPTERDSEIQTRYADTIFDLLFSRGSSTLTGDRAAIDRVVGCCRDFAVLFLSMLRHKGIPARGRVGFALYLIPGWWMDHVVVEVWDEKESRWRSVDPGMPTAWQRKVDGKPVDWLDIQEDVWLTGPKAWQAARTGTVDPEKFVVAPKLDLPFLRGWAYLAHNTILDLATLAKTEMLLWDQWGMLDRFTGGPVADEDAKKLDEISSVTSHADIDPAAVEKLMAQDGLRIPDTITQLDPRNGPPQMVEVRRVLKT